jgi:hypothetical protein
MTTREDIENKLAEYRARHTGKDPFGPWTDLKSLYASLDAQGRQVMLMVLSERREDSFWKDFIQLFERGRAT